MGSMKVKQDYGLTKDNENEGVKKNSLFEVP